MSNPLVAAIMLVNGREEMVARAVRGYNAQTYSRRVLVSWPGNRGLSIGTYRNEAAASAKLMGADIVCHFDSDDLSGPNRIAEQVALLQSSGADCVGYREVMFWDRNAGKMRMDGGALYSVPTSEAGEAWIYTSRHPSWCHGASLCYWRKTWERNPFPDMNAGEDLVWQAGLKRASVSAITTPVGHLLDTEPRLICGLHGGNTSAAIVSDAPEWKRAVSWDARVRDLWEAKCTD